MNTMNTIHSFTDHPSLKSDQATTIYLLDEEFYFANEDNLHRIELTKLKYTNMGEPFRQLARLEFNLTATQRSQSITSGRLRQRYHHC
jgi:prophage antirepressor-like protein